MFFLAAVMLAGILLGWPCRENIALATTNRHLAHISLWALLAAMGAKLALHRSLFVSELSILFAAIASSAVLTIVFFLVFWVAGVAKRGGHKEKTAHRLPEVQSGPKGNSSRCSGTGELLSVAINGGCIVAGFLLFWCLPVASTEIFPIGAFTDWLLRALLFFIGFDLGVELHCLGLRRLTPKLLLVPFFNIALSLATGLLFGLLSGTGARQGSLLTAGMGWYSLSSVLLADRGMMMLSILAFIHNVFRELLAILCAPLAARVSPMLPVYLGGATSMDVMLPFVQRYCGKEYTLVSFYSGAVCSIAVLPLVKMISG